MSPRQRHITFLIEGAMLSTIWYIICPAAKKAETALKKIKNKRSFLSDNDVRTASYESSTLGFVSFCLMKTTSVFCRNILICHSPLPLCFLRIDFISLLHEDCACQKRTLTHPVTGPQQVGCVHLLLLLDQSITCIVCRHVLASET